MIDPLLLAISLAGFLFSQVTSLVSDLGEADLQPVAFVIHGEEQRFVVFEGKTLEEMVALGRKELPASSHDAWAFAYEGYVTIAGRREGAVMIEAWAQGATQPVILAQRWRRSEDRKTFTTIGAPVLLPRVAEAGVSMAGSLPPELTTRELKAFESGVAQQKALKARGLDGRAADTAAPELHP